MFLFAYPRCLVQTGLTRVLSAAGNCEVEVASCGAEAIQKLSALHTLLVCAWTLPDISGVRLAQQLQQAGARVPIMMLARSRRPEDARAALRAGCQSFLWEGSSVEELRQALSHLQQGMAYVSRDADSVQLRGLLQQPRKKRAVELLTPRQQEVLALLVQGLGVSAIAAQLGISPKTVETHRTTIRDRTGCATLATLTLFAEAHGMRARFAPSC